MEIESVKYTDLINGMEFVCGKGPVDITIFLVTINGSQLQYSFEALKNLNKNISFKVNIIKNIYPTSVAYNEMRVRCTTPYFIQLDEDMELFPDALDTIIKCIGNKAKKNIFMYAFKLRDEILGSGVNKSLDSLKVYVNCIMSQYEIPKTTTISSSVDSMWHAKINQDGYVVKSNNIILAYHGKHRKCFDLMIRYCKMSKTYISQTTRTYTGNICKLKYPFYNLYDKIDINILYNDLVIVFQSLYNLKSTKFIKYNSAMCNCFNREIDDSYTVAYNIKNTFEIKNITSIDTSHVIQSLYRLHKINIRDFEHVFCIIGCIIAIFNQYEYSYDKYPYGIYNFFNKIFDRTCIFNVDNKYHSKLFMYDNVHIHNSLNENYIYNTDIITPINKFVFSNNEIKNNTILVLHDPNIENIISISDNKLLIKDKNMYDNAKTILI